jgi:NAD(P)-dependent dehydrogenase (short-subunit alcohol dehydrogenase family)
MGRLDKKVAIITGSASGMGRASALLFVREGAAVVVADINEAGGEAVVHECRQAGSKAVFQHTNVAVEADVKALVARAVGEFGRLDIMFNNAFKSDFSDIETLAVEQWDDVFAVCARGVFLGIKHAIPQLRIAGGGSIINTSSGGGLFGHGQPSIHAYCAAKAAIINLTQSAAVALGKDRIWVNCICPGWTSTPPIYAGLPKGKAQADEILAGLQPLARAGQPEDIAAVALFLASGESSWLTGVVLPADGGQSARPSLMMTDVSQFTAGMGPATSDRR